MSKPASAKVPESVRRREHSEMIEAALSRPGIRDVMKVYGDWQEKDRALDPYRSAMKPPVRTVTTTSSDAC